MYKYLVFLALLCGCSSTQPDSRKEFFDEHCYCRILAHERQNAIVEFEGTDKRMLVPFHANGPIPMPGETWYIIYDTNQRYSAIIFVRKVPSKTSGK